MRRRCGRESSGYNDRGGGGNSSARDFHARVYAVIVGEMSERADGGLGKLRCARRVYKYTAESMDARWSGFLFY